MRRKDRWTKVPFSPVTLHPVRTNDAGTWGSFERALGQYGAGGVDGVGFAFSREAPYSGVDLDGCRDPVSGDIAAWASDILELVHSYAEVSPSGTGVKVIVRGDLPCSCTGRRRRLHDIPAQDGRTPEIEAYHHGRYFALTGTRVDGMPSTIEPRQAALHELWNRFFVAAPCPTKVLRNFTGLTAAPYFTDAELLDLARRARTGARFCELYDEGSLDAYDGDHSRADLALCGMLAFWTNGDGARVDRLFRQSALMRPKWDERHAADGATYGEMTVRRSLGAHSPEA
ncbi:MAG: hypothetical protein ABIG44_17600 [Planctomycetota bacterium]